jgi:hypothetical protein
MGIPLCVRSLVLAAACGLSACNSAARELESTRPVERRAVSVPSSPAAGVPSAVAPAPPASSDGRATWDKVKLEDDVPLCVFADPDQRDEAHFLKDVRKQTLRAKTKVTFGAFAPGCMSEVCDAIPSLQCWIEDPGKSPEGDEGPHSLVVHSHFSFEHKPGSVCTTNCRSVTAGCDTPVLEAGKYTVKYGHRTFTLRVPSVLRTPCFKMD